MNQIKLENVKFTSPFETNGGLKIVSGDSIIAYNVVFTESAFPTACCLAINCETNTSVRYIDVDKFKTEGISEFTIVTIGNVQDSATVSFKNVQIKGCKKFINFLNSSGAKKISVNLEDVDIEDVKECVISLDTNIADLEKLSEVTGFGKDSLTINLKNVTVKGVQVSAEDVYLKNIVALCLADGTLVEYSEENKALYPTVNIL